MYDVRWRPSADPPAAIRPRRGLLVVAGGKNSPHAALPFHISLSLLKSCTHISRTSRAAKLDATPFATIL